MRARRREADFQHVMRAAPGVKDDAAAAVAVRVDEIADRRFDPGLAERLDDKAALPRAVWAGLPNAATRSRRRCRNADRSARCVRRSIFRR